MARRRGLQHVTPDGRVQRNIVGPRLKEARARQSAPCSIDHLSDLVRDQLDLHITRDTIAKIEAGRRLAHDFEVAAFARVLHVRADWLLGLTDHHEPVDWLP